MPVNTPISMNNQRDLDPLTLMMLKLLTDPNVDKDKLGVLANVLKASRKGFEVFVDPKAITRGDIPISPVGPGTLGGMPFRPSGTAEALAGVGGTIANVLEALGQRRSRQSGQSALEAALAPEPPKPVVVDSENKVMPDDKAAGLQARDANLINQVLPETAVGQAPNPTTNPILGIVEDLQSRGAGRGRIQRQRRELDVKTSEEEDRLGRVLGVLARIFG